jgi:signal transduction histidine kinase
LVILALLLSQGATGFLAIFLQPHREPPAFPSETAAHVATIIKVLGAAPAADRPRIAAAIDAKGIAFLTPDRFDLGDSEPAGEAAVFRRMIEDQLGERVPLRLIETETTGRMRPILVAARLNDGSTIQIATTLMAPPNIVEFSLMPTLFYLPFVALAIAMLTIWATRRVTAPLRAFAAAAERLGNEHSVPLLTEQGPVELRRAARSFNKMQEQLKRFVDDRTRMLAAISHDMRTPVTRLRLRVEAGVDDEEEQQKMLQDLDLMDAMIRSVLSFLRDGIPDEAVELVNIASLLESVCDDFSDTGRNAHYVGLANFPLRCRPTMLGRAMTNLVENAVKFAGAATIDLRYDESGNAVIFVDDDGPGIPAAEIKKAFDPFYRVDPARNIESGGVGLGLSIAKAIIEAHAGHIKLTNRTPRGLRAVVTLPPNVESCGL